MNVKNSGFGGTDELVNFFFDGSNIPANLLVCAAPACLHVASQAQLYRDAAQVEANNLGNVLDKWFVFDFGDEMTQYLDGDFARVGVDQMMTKAVTLGTNIVKLF